MVRKTPRSTSVPPDSATARAKKAWVGERESSATPKATPRAKGTHPTKLAQIADTIYDHYKGLLPNLLPRHNTRLRACTKEWYKKMYDTGYQVSREVLLDMLQTQVVNELRINNPEGEDTENMKKGLAVLKEAMTNLNIILPEAVVEAPTTGSGVQSSQSQKESEETESAPPSKARKGRSKTRKTKKKLQALQESSQSATAPDASKELECGSV